MNSQMEKTYWNDRLLTKLWELGYKDINALARKEKGYSRLEGLYMGLASGIINLILALLILLGWFIENQAIDAVAGVAVTISLLTEGMYTGLLSLSINGVSLNSLGFMYLLITLPMIIVSTLAYMAGTHDFKLLGGSKKK